MRLITISKELNLAEADLKMSRLNAANFHPVLQNESAALYLGTAVGAGGFLRVTGASGDVQGTNLEVGGFQVGGGIRIRY